MKRFFAIAVSLMLVGSLMGSVVAAETPVVTYDGGTALTYTDEAGKQLSGNGDFGTAFSDMLPGVSYEQRILLKNTSSDTVKFYMNLNVLKTLKNAKLDGAGYTVILSDSSNTLYSSVNGTISGTLIGGSGSGAELGDLNKAFYSSDGTGMLVATVQPGGSERLTLRIQADATMSNAYQGADGTLQFQFFGEVPQSGGVTKVVTLPGETRYETTEVNDTTRNDETQNGQNGIKTVQTGDNSPIYLVAAILVVAVILLLITGRKKKGSKQDKDDFQS